MERICGRGEQLSPGVSVIVSPSTEGYSDVRLYVRRCFSARLLGGPLDITESLKLWLTATYIRICSHTQLHGELGN
jgi:hypothetical protein